MIIVTPLVNATTAALAVATTCGVSTVYDLGSLESGQKLYAGQHVLSTAAGANTIQFKIYSASSSGAGFGAAETLLFTFSAVACRFAEWPAPLVTAFATCERFYRAQWATSCVGRLALVWMSRNCADPA
jgi:hypothetical protein